MSNKWIKRIKNAQDNFFDKQVAYGNYEEVSDFDREYFRAKNITSISGELCKISGGIGLFFGLYFVFIFEIKLIQQLSLPQHPFFFWPLLV